MDGKKKYPSLPPVPPHFGWAGKSTTTWSSATRELRGITHRYGEA
jgi:hypothetical protein